MSGYLKNMSDAFPGAFELKGAELSVYLYICHRYCLQSEAGVVLPIEEMVTGGSIDSGCGVSRSAVIKALPILRESGYLKSKEADPGRSDRNKRATKSPIMYRPMIRKAGGVFAHFTVSTGRMCPEENAQGTIQPEQGENEPVNRAQLTGQEVPLEGHPPTEGWPPCGVGDRPAASPNSVRVGREVKGFDLNLSSSAKDYDTSPLKEYKFIAGKLAERLAANNRLQRPPKITSWADQLYALSNSLAKVSDEDPDQVYKRILSVAKWTCRNLGARYVPQVFSAKSFCEKFVKLEAAMRQQEQAIAEEREASVAYEDRLVLGQPERELSEDELKAERDAHLNSISHKL